MAINGAGEGSLTIDITHNGRIIPAQIVPDPRRSGEYSVQFKPQGSGFYTIRVFFAEVEVSGDSFIIVVVVIFNCNKMCSCCRETPSHRAIAHSVATATEYESRPLDHKSPAYSRRHLPVDHGMQHNDNHCLIATNGFTIRCYLQQSSFSTEVNF